MTTFCAVSSIYMFALGILISVSRKLVLEDRLEAKRACRDHWWNRPYRQLSDAAAFRCRSHCHLRQPRLEGALSAAPRVAIDPTGRDRSLGKRRPPGALVSASRCWMQRWSLTSPATGWRVHSNSWNASADASGTFCIAAPSGSTDRVWKCPPRKRRRERHLATTVRVKLRSRRIF